MLNAGFENNRLFLNLPDVDFENSGLFLNLFDVDFENSHVFLFCQMLYLRIVGYS